MCALLYNQRVCTYTCICEWGRGSRNQGAGVAANGACHNTGPFSVRGERSNPDWGVNGQLRCPAFTLKHWAVKVLYLSLAHLNQQLISHTIIFNTMTDYWPGTV